MSDQPPQGPDVKLGDTWRHLVAVTRSAGGYVHWAEPAATTGRSDDNDRAWADRLLTYRWHTVEDEDEDLPPQPPQAKLDPEDFG